MVSAQNIHVDESKPALLFEILREVPPAHDAPEGIPSRYVRVYKSEMSSSSDSIEWQPADLDEASLDNGDPDSMFVINVLNFQSDGSYKIIGAVKMNSSQAASHASTGKEIPLLGAAMTAMGRIMRKSIQRVSGNPISKTSYMNPLNSPGITMNGMMARESSKFTRASAHRVTVTSIRIEKWEARPRQGSMADFLRGGAEVSYRINPSDYQSQSPSPYKSSCKIPS